MMRISQLLKPGTCIVLEHWPDSGAEGVIKTALDCLGPEGHRKSHPKAWPRDLAGRLLDSMKYADLGHGIVLPHARMEEIKEIRLACVTIHRSRRPGGTEHGEPFCFMVFLTPLDKPDMHLQLMAHLAWLASQESFRLRAAQATDAQALETVIRQSDLSGQGGFSSLGKDAVYAEMQSRPQGLSEQEVQNRLSQSGPNQLKEENRTQVWTLFARNLVSVFALLLWVGGGLCFVPGVDMPQLGFAIFAVVIINAVFSFWQEFKAEKAVQALQELIPRQATVRRAGTIQEIPASNLVWGDVVCLEEGDLIPADTRLMETHELRVNNSALTGESRPLYKTADGLEAGGESFLWTELPGMVFAGTTVSAGTGEGVVIGTGMNTEIGRIAGLTQSVKREPSPLQKEIKGVVNIITAISLGLGLVFYLLGWLAGGLGWIGALVFAIGIVVANIPEGLLPTMSLALAMGAQRLARRQVLVKHLAGVETLGSTTVICTDKTGTITTNRVRVEELWQGGPPFDPESPQGRRMLEVSLLCNNARLAKNDGNEWVVQGDPTEGALLILGMDQGIDWQEIQTRQVRLGHMPFESVRKRMSTVHRRPDGSLWVAVKGAPLELLEQCCLVAGQWGQSLETVSSHDSGGQSSAISQSMRETIRAKVDEMARKGMRTMAYAWRELGTEESSPQEWTKENLERNLIFLGLTGMIDPPRPEVAQAVAQCRTAGIRLIMITGDYGPTACAVARMVGMAQSGEELLQYSGKDLERMDDQALLTALKGSRPIIFSRMDPGQKMRVVSALKDSGQVVAVTGDGVNDAAALKKADIGIAMGAKVNDVAKEAAGMIVLDGNFASIVAAVEEGRAVYANIRRFITYVLSSNVPELVPFVLFVLARFPLALTIMQILAIDLGTDLVPALGLGVEQAEAGLMQRPPRSRKERLIDVKLLLRAYLWLGGLEAALSLLAFGLAMIRHGHAWGSTWPQNGPDWQLATTVSLAAIVACQIGNVFACRTSKVSVFKARLLSNHLVLAGILCEMTLLAGLIYVPPLASVFGLVPMDLQDWLTVLPLPFAMVGCEEIRKLLLRRTSRKPSSGP